MFLPDFTVGCAESHQAEPHPGDLGPVSAEGLRGKLLRRGHVGRAR